MLVAGALPVAPTIARGAAAQGAQVVLCVPHGEQPDDGSPGDVRTADTSREDEVDALFDFALARLDRLDVVVVALGAMPVRSLLETSLAQWNDAPGSALRSAFLLCRRAIEEWLGSGGGGRIVLVTPGFESGPGQAPAAAAEAALLSLMRSLIKEYGGRGISCNTVVSTRDTHSGTGSDLPSLVEAVAFFASDESSYVTGECLRMEPRIR